MQKTFGGDRLGSGNKNDVYLHNYERSTHDLSRTWRSSMACGTLVPFFNEIALNGDTFDIDLDAIVKTIPATGPIFGSFKLQLDVFECPMRLYNGVLHNNALNIGMNMSQVKFPKINVPSKSRWLDMKFKGHTHQINPSSLMSYIGVNGLGVATSPKVYQNISRKFNAIPILAYWDIVKNYYANKQETNAYYIGCDEEVIENAYITEIVSRDAYWGKTNYHKINWTEEDWHLYWYECHRQPDSGTGYFWVEYIFHGCGLTCDNIYIGGQNIQTLGEVYDQNGTIVLRPTEGLDMIITAGDVRVDPEPYTRYKIGIKEFPLNNIDRMREDILRGTYLGQEFLLNDHDYAPYNEYYGLTDDGFTRNITPMAGLALKTYQSDLFNNWVKTDWIDGVGGISEITKVSTQSGGFTIDALNLAQKVYNMLNRIAVSGGSYEDWQEAVYGEDALRRAESPIYCGGISQEIVFEEVVNTAQSEGSPLGDIGGRGTLIKAHDNGHIVIHVKEPSYIMGIVSITPRIDYSQGNKWYMNAERLDSYNDLHKPALDGIGFENLMAEQMAWFDRVFKTDGSLEEGRAIGKVPSWINYMTAIDEVHGDFAEPLKNGFMVLNRNYEWDEDNLCIKDATTYIDPTHFNYPFAYTELDAQNFWVQIGSKCIARRKMSAKIIPNL